MPNPLPPLRDKLAPTLRASARGVAKTSPSSSSPSSLSPSPATPFASPSRLRSRKSAPAPVARRFRSSTWLWIGRTGSSRTSCLTGLWARGG